MIYDGLYLKLKTHLITQIKLMGMMANKKHLWSNTNKNEKTEDGGEWEASMKFKNKILSAINYLGFYVLNNFKCHKRNQK